MTFKENYNVSPVWKNDLFSVNNFHFLLFLIFEKIIVILKSKNLYFSSGSQNIPCVNGVK